MFFHNFKYSFKTLFRNKMLIFWTFAFPIILGTLFNMAFQDIEKKEKLDIIDIAIAQTDFLESDSSSLFHQVFKELGNEGSDTQLFHIQYVKEEEAEDLLSKNQITGYFVLDGDHPRVVVNRSGINETVFQSVVGEILETQEAFKNISEKWVNDHIQDITKDLVTEKENFDSWYQETYANIVQKLNEENIQIEDTSSKNLSYTMIEYYTLIAMTCLYGGILGMTAMNQCLANMSHNGKRVSVAPISKAKLILSSACSSYLTQLIGLLLLFLYTIFVIHVDYGSNLLLIVLLSLVGSFAGLSLGIFVASIFKSNENTKVGVMISFTMFGCVLSGMMGITMKYVIDKNIPIVNYLNPVNMITDGFYALYYYDTLERYFFNVISLVLFSLLLIGISTLCLRRQKYEHI